MALFVERYRPQRSSWRWSAGTRCRFVFASVWKIFETYRRYVAACCELRAMPLTRTYLLRLIDCLAERAARRCIELRKSRRATETAAHRSRETNRYVALPQAAARCSKEQTCSPITGVLRTTFV